MTRIAETVRRMKEAGITVKVGDKIKRTIKVYDDESRSFAAQTLDTTVVFVHPERRFLVVRCDMPGGRHFHETLYFYPRCANGYTSSGPSGHLPLKGKAN